MKIQLLVSGPIYNFRQGKDFPETPNSQNVCDGLLDTWRILYVLLVIMRKFLNWCKLIAFNLQPAVISS